MDAYLDNSATTPVCPQAVEAMQECMQSCWGNPSSQHQKGLEAQKRLDYARALLASYLQSTEEEIVFTSGGTESNNLALLGAANAMRRFGNRIISTGIEHPSVEECLKLLGTRGFEIVRLPVDRYGRIAEADLAHSLNKNTVLVSIMSVNNEVGTLQPIESAKRMILSHRSPALLHCDAVQSFGKTELRPSALGVDLMSISAHKIHGPKGVGALYIKKGLHLHPMHYGGLQERGLRPGTEPLPAIAGFAAALQALPEPGAAQREIAALRDYLVQGLRGIGGIAINSPENALPYITNISVLGKNGNNLMNYLSGCGVYVSTGSACSKGKPSKVLRAMGLSKEQLDGALRISFSHTNTREDVDKLLGALTEGKKLLRSL